jgi:hypothetical protein
MNFYGLLLSRSWAVAIAVFFSSSAMAEDQNINLPDFQWSGQKPNQASEIRDVHGKPIGMSVRDVDTYNSTDSIPIYSDQFTAQIGGAQKNYSVSYTSIGHFHQWESGECHWASCDHTCTETATLAHFDRVLSERDTAGHYNVVSNKSWGIGDATWHVGDSCASMNLAIFRTAVLGTYGSWQPKIDQDVADIKNGNP